MLRKLATLILAISVSHSVHSAIIEIHFLGEISTEGMGYQLGDSISGHFTLDTSKAGSSADTPNSRSYYTEGWDGDSVISNSIIGNISETTRHMDFLGVYNNSYQAEPWHWFDAPENSDFIWLYDIQSTTPSQNTQIDYGMDIQLASSIYDFIETETLSDIDFYSNDTNLFSQLAQGSIWQWSALYGEETYNEQGDYYYRPILSETMDGAIYQLSEIRIVDVTEVLEPNTFGLSFIVFLMTFMRLNKKSSFLIFPKPHRKTVGQPKHSYGE
ncbi:hypothetical protein [Teredinibacter sp. KSP-S5-2]|uniref:hypothetical protein n=1 Tax=Teredinibacter sp. KSP-S5-2 TaxID=3034506 RepID=UPI0029346585|nr:hypothetical protein [Teredinibacter sp. KSP-S5-2]WNO10348.1 hypothetical protein P5V12_04100 [Teredinibacter sp. KSP-S5-2]